MTKCKDESLAFLAALLVAIVDSIAALLAYRDLNKCKEKEEIKKQIEELQKRLDDC